MNQSILFNDDHKFNDEHHAWSLTGQMSGQLLRFYVHSHDLSKLATLDACTKYDLEEICELWLEKNEPESHEIHITL